VADHKKITHKTTKKEDNVDYFVSVLTVSFKQLLSYFHWLVALAEFWAWRGYLSDFLFVQNKPEGFTAFRTVKKSDCQLSLFSFFVRTTSHLPGLPRRGDFSSTILAFCHSSIPPLNIRYFFCVS
jgi:hypothetical protein